MLIKIINGVFGHRLPNGMVKAVRPGGAAIEVADDVAARLIKRGFAEAVEPEAPKAPDTEPEKIPEYSKDNTMAELREIAAEMGIDDEEITGAKNKAALLELMNNTKAAIEAEPDDDEAGPIINADEALL